LIRSPTFRACAVTRVPISAEMNSGLVITPSPQDTPWSGGVPSCVPATTPAPEAAAFRASDDITRQLSGVEMAAQ
jgi:hypothetical protein